MNKPSDLPLQDPTVPGLTPGSAAKPAGVAGTTAATGAAGKPLAHESAAMHVAGAAPYTDDVPELAGTLHAALGLSPIAHGVIEKLDLDPVRAMPGVVAVLSAKDIPGANECGPLVHDDPILAGEAGATLRHIGQPVFVVIAHTREQARRAAATAKKAVIAKPLPPILTPEAARTPRANMCCRRCTSSAATPAPPSTARRGA